MKKVITTAAVGIGVAVASVALAMPASAASFYDDTVNHVDFKYNDGKDKFSALAHNYGGRGIEVRVTLKDIDPRPGYDGPTRTFKDRNIWYSDSFAGWTSRSLATAKEDTRYKATITVHETSGQQIASKVRKFNS